MVDFKNLEAFVWVSRLKSFRMAASRLHTTQPAISYRIAQLEGDLGVQLLERDKRSVVLTPAGLDAMDYALKLLELRSEFVTHVGSTKALGCRSLRLGVSETMVHTILPARDRAWRLGQRPAALDRPELPHQAEGVRRWHFYSLV